MSLTDESIYIFMQLLLKINGYHLPQNILASI